MCWLLCCCGNNPVLRIATTIIGAVLAFAAGGLAAKTLAYYLLREDASTPFASELFLPDGVFVLGGITLLLVYLIGTAAFAAVARRIRAGAYSVLPL